MEFIIHEKMYHILFNLYLYFILVLEYIFI